MNISSNHVPKEKKDRERYRKIEVKQDYFWQEQNTWIHVPIRPSHCSGTTQILTSIENLTCFDTFGIVSEDLVTHFSALAICAAHTKKQKKINNIVSGGRP